MLWDPIVTRHSTYVTYLHYPTIDVLFATLHTQRFVSSIKDIIVVWQQH